jgi:glycosyltransferase involved in cell wall biosynthesis
MRILVANDSFTDAGGVQSYLDAVISALQDRGHAVALVAGAAGAQGLDVAAQRRWAPDVCFSHNMNDLAVDERLATIAPVVKFMHGYFGTCLSGLKMHAVPGRAACDRVFGTACAGLYLPRRCGPASPAFLARQWRWNVSQQRLFGRYAAIVVASRHMQREYEKNGADAGRVWTNPLFSTRPVRTAHADPPADPHVVFMGRMTPLKGGDLLVRAVANAQKRLARPVKLTMAGDGPQRSDWKALAHRLGVEAAFPGWLEGDRRWPVLEAASVIAVPSVWPEPFALVGLEAGALGVPAVASDTGGISEWLHDGVNGVLVRAPVSPERFGDALASTLADRPALRALGAGALARAREMTVAAHVSRLEVILERASQTAFVS